MYNFPLTAVTLIAFACLSTTTRAEVSYNLPWKNSHSINDGWHYLENGNIEIGEVSRLPETHSDFLPIDLPHTWNAQDTLAGKEYRRDASWYRRSLQIPETGKALRHFLRFSGVGQQAKVYVNGKPVGEHRGGYAAFTVEITDVVQAGDNRIDVWASNAKNPDLGPINADFNFYGGIYRSVHYLQAPLTCLSRNTQGGPGVRVWSANVSKDSADLQATVDVDNGDFKAKKLRVRCELLDPTGRVVSLGEQEASFGEQAMDATGVATVEIAFTDIVAPQLWTPESPVLYKLRVQLFAGARMIDETTVNHGFRWVRFTNEGDFYLNGQLYDLHGVNRHQDLEGSGNAVSLEHHERDIRLIKELGANWLRLAHYQQDDYVLDLCDRLGLLVWEEIPYVNIFTASDAFQANYATMLREMISQHYNHPSIIMWGVQNEILLKQPGEFEQEKLELAKYLAGVAREEDPHRVIVQAGHGTKRYGELGIMALTDVVGYNVYYGWYGGAPEQLTKNMAGLQSLQLDRPHVISEYGAGSDIRIHTETPKSQDFSEEWHVHYVESYLDQFDQMPICGTLYWNMFDFGAAHRGDTIPHVNQKGLVTFDRKTKKDVWYLVKSRWSDQPVLYLVSPRFKQRTGDAEKEYRVLTNFDQVELFHQGKSLGVQTSGFRWRVRLELGENALLAKGQKDDHKDQHGFTVSFTPDGK